MQVTSSALLSLVVGLVLSDPAAKDRGDGDVSWLRCMEDGRNIPPCLEFFFFYLRYVECVNTM